MHRYILILCVLCVGLATGPLDHQAAAQSGTTYYVDADTGNDNNDGLSPSAAWETVDKVNDTNDFDPGDSILFKRGTTYNDQLEADVDGVEGTPITYGAYGEGALPRFRNPAATGSSIEIRGNWVVVDGLEAFHLDSDYDSQGVGHLLGYGISGDDVVLQHSSTDNNAIGLYLRGGSNRARVLNNNIVNNHHDPDSNTGPTGVQLRGTDNEVAYNYLTGNQHPTDNAGTAFELWEAVRANMHHNVVMWDRKFVEMGSSGDDDEFEESGEIHSRDNVIAYNYMYNDFYRDSDFGARGIVTRGVGNDPSKFGPVWNTQVHHNTFVFANQHDNEAVTCGGCGPDILTLQNNIFATTERGAWTGGADPVEDHNIWYDLDSGTSAQTVGFTKDSTSLGVDPQLIDPANGDFHISATSPAIDAGTTTSGYSSDQDGDPVPSGPAADIGADEYVDPDSPLLDGLAAYWSLDEASGTRADSVDDNDLSDNNSVGSTTGIQGDAASFSAASSQYLSVTDDPALVGGDADWTWAAWVKLASTDTTQVIVSKQTSSTTRVFNLQYSAFRDRFQLIVDDAGGTIVGRAEANALGAPSTDTWYFVVAWHDSTADSVNIQVNNGTVDSASTTGTPMTSTADLRIGAAYDGSNPHNFWDGQIDELAPWNRVLTTEERTELYSGGVGQTYPFSD